MNFSREILSKNVIFFRKKLGLTQSQLAEKSDLSIKMIQKIEYKSVNPSSETIDRIAQALGVTASDLYKDPSEQKINTSRPNTEIIKQAVEKAVNEVFQISQAPPQLHTISHQKLELNDDEIELIKNFRAMNDEDKDTISCLAEERAKKTRSGNNEDAV